MKREPSTTQHPYHHGSLAKAALQEAHRILAKRGADAVTIRGIARGVGVTPNALYRHFKDKNALLAKLAEEGFRELTRRSRSIRVQDPQKRFREMASSYVRFGKAKPAVLQLMFGQSISKASKKSGLAQAAEEAFMDLLEGAAAAAGLPAQNTESVQLAIACWSLVHGYTTLLTKHALDFVEEPHGIEHLVQFIDLDPRHWNQ